MAQHVKKRRTGWAIIAAAAMIASILAAVGTSPAAAATGKPDFEAQWKACVGPALEASDFEDVAMDSVHYDSINCLAYYGITKGTTADTFNPSGNVTRSQMALFLARAADAAGVDLGDAMDMGFTDLNADDTERVNAINRLVAKGIMFGDTQTSFDPPSTTRFAPTDHVTRWEMAMFLFAFLDHALESVLVDEWPASVDGDSAGRVELGSQDGGRTGTRVDDYFGDARRQTPAHVDDRISAIYELGVTNGTNQTIGENGTFDPNGLVTRAQMASFITRALGHTNLRPAGLTAQSTNDDTQVSLRDADFVPVTGERTEVFTTNFPEDAFDANGGCIERYITGQDPSFDHCEIDQGDRITEHAFDNEGNALWLGVGLRAGHTLTIPCTAAATMEDTYTFTAPSTRGGAPNYTILAWTGAVGDKASQDDLFVSEPANVLSSLNEATKAVITGGVPHASNADNGIHVAMGASVTYTVQLRDAKGRPVGPSPNEHGELPTFEVQVDTYTELRHPSNSANAAYRDHLSGDINGAGPDGVEGNGDDADVVVPTYDSDTDAENGIDAFTGDDFTRRRYRHVPDENGQFTFAISVPDRQRHQNNPDQVIRVYVRRANPENHDLDIVDMTDRMGTSMPGAAVQLYDVRFSDNDATAQQINVDAPAWRLRSVRNRNSVTVTVHDQYGNLYRAGDHEVQITDTIVAGAGAVEEDDPANPDFPGEIPGPFGATAEPEVAEDATGDLTLRGGYGIGTSGRRPIGYTHNGTVPLAQMLNLQLRIPGVLGTLDDPATNADERVDTVNPVEVAGGTATATILWADRGRVNNNTKGLPLLLGDPAANELVVNAANLDENADAKTPVAYPYGPDDEFIVEGQVVNIDQFEEILAQINNPMRRILIAADTTLSWVGYDFNRPRDGASWSIDGLICSSPAAGD